MTPDFALSLSFDGIRLYLRMDDGWGSVGEVALDDPALGKALAGLRDAARAIAPDGFQTKLIIPNAQIKYLTLDTGEVDDAARWVAARAALDGATPYQVDELAFDLKALGVETQVAAVAYETLSEAEAFAVTHGFGPVCFVAMPEPGHFAGEPFFGETALFKGEHGPGAKVTRDAKAIVVVGPAVLPFEAAADTPPEAAAPAPMDAALPDNDGAAPQEAAPEIEAAAEGMSSDQLAEAVLGTPKEEVKFEFRAADAGEDMPVSSDVATDLDHVVDHVLPGDVDSEDTPGAQTNVGEPADAAEAPEAEARIDDDAPMAFSGTDVTEGGFDAAGEDTPDDIAPTDQAAEAPGEKTPPEKAETPEAEPAQEVASTETPDASDADAPAMGAFHSARRVDVVADDTAAPGPNAPDDLAHDLPPDLSSDLPSDLPSDLAEGPPDGESDRADTAPSQSADDPAADNDTAGALPVFRRASRSAPALSEPAPETDASEGPTIGFASRRGDTPQVSVPKLGGVTRPGQPDGPAISITAPSIPVDGDTPDPPPLREATHPGLAASLVLQPEPAQSAQPRAAAPAPALAAGAAAVSLDEADRLTVFGARQSNVGGKPRFLGLLLTAILIVFLAGVAAWAAVFMDDGLAGLFKPRTGTEPEIAAVPAPAIDVPVPQSDTAAEPPQTTVAALAPEVPAPDSTPDARPEPLPAPVASTADENPRTETEKSLGVVWTRAPSTPLPAALVPVDDVFAPGLGSADDARRLPDRNVPPVLASLQADDVILTPALPAPPGITFDLDARGLVIARPEGAMNPDGIMIFAGRPPVVPPERPAPPAAAETDTLEALHPEIAELAAYRPRLRPADLQLSVPDAPPETADADLPEEQADADEIARDTAAQVRAALAAYRPVLRPKVARTEAEERAEEQGAPPTAQAVQVSFRPSARPRNFERIVARATPRPEADATPTRTPVRTVAPRTVTPSVPSAASVSREATVRNAINLSRINLIGVYGKPAERRALVRLSNGRYQKVKVGDRLDGGQVSAIGDGELRYEKRGRNVILRMPKG